MESSSSMRDDFSIADYVVFAGMLCISTFIGIYYAWKDRKQMDSKDYLTSNKSLSLFPVAMSLLASFQSSVTILGYPAEMFLRGTQFWMVIFGGILASVMAAEVFLPVYYDLSFTSVNKYLLLRFGSENVRIASSITFIMGTVPYMGVVLYGPSLALASVTPLTLETSILLIGIICTFYTTIGGIKAVVWTDTIQVFLMFAGLVAVMIRGFELSGGVGRAFQLASDAGRLEFFNVNLDPYSTNNLWNVVFGMGIMWCGNYCTSQTEVARYCNVSSKGRAKVALYINMVGMILLISCACLCGVALFGVYGDCDPLKLGLIQKSDQLMPYFVMDTLKDYPGVPGLFVACVFSASLSTLSSGYNALATVTWDDFLQHTSMSKMSDIKIKVICKLAGVVYGVLSIGMAFIVGLLGSVLSAAISLAGALFGPLFGLYILALLCPFSNTIGVLSGLFVGQAFTIWILIGSLLYPGVQPTYPTTITGCSAELIANSPVMNATTPVIDNSGIFALYHVAYLLVPITGFVVSLIVGGIVSLWTGGIHEVSHVKPAHLSALCWSLWPKSLLPDRNRRKSEPTLTLSLHESPDKSLNGINGTFSPVNGSNLTAI